MEAEGSGVTFWLLMGVFACCGVSMLSSVVLRYFVFRGTAEPIARVAQVVGSLATLWRLLDVRLFVWRGGKTQRVQILYTSNTAMCAYFLLNFL